MANNILVTPEKLINTSQEFLSIGSQVNSLTQQMTQAVNSLNTSWTGEASTAFSSKFNALQDDMTKMYRMINEHVNDLQEMARNYQQAEATNAQSANALKGDIIS